MFVDEAVIEVKAGAGGNGAVSLHREKYAPRGGPDGGDGGNGGDVILEAKAGLATLLDFRFRSHFKAERGLPGGGNNKAGRSGQDCIIHVPPGTLVFDADDGTLIADLDSPGTRVIVARGGRGGRGNARFATSTRQLPRFAERGEPGERRRLRLELTVLADVGVIGMPNAGKSTLIAALSAARPKIADYPFTTLVPNLGVVRVDKEHSFVMADLPGLIEGAHRGEGLGHQFLRHVERTPVLVHVLDMSPETGRNPLSDFDAINKELRLFNEHLAEVPQIVAANKMDLEEARERFGQVRETLAAHGYTCIPISAVTRTGLSELVSEIARGLEQAGPPPIEAIKREAGPPQDRTEEPLSVRKLDDETYEARGSELSRLVAMTDMDNDEALRHLHRQLERLGVLRLLEEAGVAEGDTVRIDDIEFDYVLTPGHTERRGKGRRDRGQRRPRRISRDQADGSDGS